MYAHTTRARRVGGSAAGNQYGTFSVKYASIAQHNFIASLFASRDTAKATGMAISHIENARPLFADNLISKKNASDVIQSLLSCPMLAKAEGIPAQNRPNKFGGRCATCKSFVKANEGWLIKVDGNWASQHKEGECVTVSDAKPVNPVTEPGMYILDGEVYKVQRSRQSGRLYAKHLSPDNGFEYSAGAIYNLSADNRMSLAQAAEFGHDTGICCNCGATLTDPKSIAAGIGPICAGRL